MAFLESPLCPFTIAGMVNRLVILKVSRVRTAVVIRHELKCVRSEERAFGGISACAVQAAGVVDAGLEGTKGSGRRTELSENPGKESVFQRVHSAYRGEEE